MKFRSKSHEVEAVRWTGTEFEGGKPDWLPPLEADPAVMPAEGCLVLLTPGWRLIWTVSPVEAVEALPGDWIIRDPPSRQSDRVFRQLYDPA